MPLGASLNLRGADLRGANLTRADLRRVTLEGSTLRGAVLCGADLTGSRMATADLRDVVWDVGTRWPEGVVVPLPAPRPACTD